MVIRYWHRIVSTLTQGSFERGDLSEIVLRIKRISSFDEVQRLRAKDTTSRSQRFFFQIAPKRVCISFSRANFDFASFISFESNACEKSVNSSNPKNGCKSCDQPATSISPRVNDAGRRLCRFPKRNLFSNIPKWSSIDTRRNGRLRTTVSVKITKLANATIRSTIWLRRQTRRRSNSRRRLSRPVRHRITYRDKKLHDLISLYSTFLTFARKYTHFKFETSLSGSPTCANNSFVATANFRMNSFDLRAAIVVSRGFSFFTSQFHSFL